MSDLFRAGQLVPGNGGGNLKDIQSPGRSDADSDSLFTVAGGMFRNPGGGDFGLIPIGRFPSIILVAQLAACEVSTGGADFFLHLR